MLEPSLEHPLNSAAWTSLKNNPREFRTLVQQTLSGGCFFGANFCDVRMSRVEMLSNDVSCFENGKRVRRDESLADECKSDPPTEKRARPAKGLFGHRQI
jgi:hypothetical protein